MHSTLRSAALRALMSLLLTYAVVISFSTPLSTRNVIAFGSGARGASKGRPSPLLKASLPQASGQRGAELLIRFRSGVGSQNRDTLVGSHGLQRKRQLRGESGVEKLEVLGGQDPETVAQLLQLQPEVEFAEPNFLIRKDQQVTSDPQFDAQWALRNTSQNGGQFGSDINVTTAWQTTTGDEGAVIAVIDSGIDFTHPDLSNNEWNNPTPGAEADLHGWDYVTDSNVIKDEQGHGTAIAGIIAAQGNNAIGITGVMWRASLMSLRVLDSTGTGDIGSAIEAIDYAVKHRAQVINLSWGTTGNSLILKDAIERAMHRGVVVVCSAGNNGQDVDQTLYYPASFGLRDLIVVASTDSFDQLATWSDYGPRNVTVAAPGTNILTTQMGGGYWTVTGTSASAPLVSGVAGLLKTATPSLGAHNLVKALTDSARQVASLSGKVASGGVVDATSALSAVRRNPYQGNGNGNGNGGGNGQGNGQPYVPPALRQDNNEGRANGKEGLHVPAPEGVPGAPLANLPNLDQSRKVRTSPDTTGSAVPIQSNLCADCDPGGGGGAGGSDPYFGTARTRRPNETGRRGITLGSRNFNWSLPIVALKGRAGLDLSIALYYNSLVWTKQGNAIQYNADHGSPAPGFQIGLPRLQAQYFDSDDNAYAYTMISSSGGRVQMKQVGTSGIYESSDSTYTQLTFSGSIPIVKTTDGTQLVFGTQVSSEWRCTQIKDRNGNYISATYNTSNGHVLTITDTLGRVVNFNYGGDSNLSTITQTWGSSTHTWATFVYGSVYMSFSFPGLYSYGVSNGSYQTVLAYVVFPENTTYNFDYNSYGQVYQIRHKAPDGHELEHTFYNISSAGSQTDCPRFTDRRDYAQDWNNNQEAITSYSVTNNATWTNPETGAQQTGSLVQVTAPEGTIYKEYSHASGWDTGLTQVTESWSGGVKKKWTSTTWTQDNTALTYPQNPRVTESNIYDEAGNRRRETIDYTSYSLPSVVREWTGSGATTLYRQTTTGYRFDGEYLNRRIIGLVDYTQVTDGAGALVSKITYAYDWGGSDMFLDTPASAVQHDRTNYGPGLIYGRGNRSQMARWDINDPQNLNNSAVETKWRVNSTGSILLMRDHLWHQIFFDYADSFSDSVNRNSFAYPTTITDQEGNSSTTQYNYDFGAITRTHAPTSGTGGGTTYVDEVRQYDAFGRLERATNQTNNAYARYVYESNGNYVHTYETVIDLTQANEFHSWQVMDGAGRVRATASDHPGSAGGFSGQYTVYDNMGRVVQQSNSTEMNGAWAPTGDDSLWRVTLQAYDWKGRPTQTTNPDGTTKAISYSGCGCAGGEVTTSQDEHGRQRRFTKDGFGRLTRVEELSWTGGVYATSNYTYNVRDQITQVDQAGQSRTFGYDGHGRQQSRTTPEQGTTTYTYNVDDTINVMTDARGATTTYGYNPRRLVTSITYGATSGVTTTPNVSLGYDAAGHRTSMSDGMGSVTYNYNNLAQLTSETRNFTGVGSFTLTYGYNLAGKLASVTNPWGAQVTYSYDKAGRVTAVNGAGYYGVSNYASAFTYRAFGSLKSMNYANGRSLSTAYDNRLRPTTWNVANVIGYNYNYDFFNEHTGRVTYAGNIYDSSLDRSYEYDHVGRLVVSHSGAEARAHAWTGQWGTMDGPYSQGYDYDVWGNITHKFGWGGEVQGGSAGQSSDIYYSYTGNRRNGFSYDAAGNLTNDLGQTFAYDVTGQQTNASYGGYSLTQSYDGDGLRVKKNDNGAQTYYLRSSVVGGQVVAEIIWASVSWQWSRGYVHLGSQLLAVQQAGVYWIHEDPVTKSKRVTNSSGTVVSTIELDPWGADTNRSSNGAFQPKKYTSYERDGNGTDEAMFRRYNRWQSRFDQPDPLDTSYSFTNPQSFNRYAYVDGDPVNFSDPSGLVESWNFCSAQYSFSDCGGWGAIYGGYFGSGYAEYQREYGGLSPEAAAGLARYNSIRTTGYDPAFDRYWGDTTITRTDAQGNVQSTQTLHNATQYQLVIAYLSAADLLQYVNGAITAHGSGSTFHVTFRFLNDDYSKAAVMAILQNTKVFHSGPFGRGHMGDVGATRSQDALDFRSVNGVLGPRSLEVMINRTNFRAYADIDRYDLYGGLAPATAHIFLELIPHMLRRFFGGK